MKKIKNQLKISILLLLLVFLFAGCSGGVSDLTPSEMPEYPTVDGGSGYTIEGYAKDKNGNPLEGVQLKISDKLHAVTDENGYYEINGLSGSQKVVPMFYDYEFTQGEFEVTSGGTHNVSGTNAKEYMIEFSAVSNATQDAKVYGVSYEINGKAYSADDYSKAFADKLSGKTIVTPTKEGFTFEPTSADIYSSGSVQFKAVPNDDRYSVSGEIDISSLDAEDSIQTVQMFVDGKLATNSFVEYSYNQDGTLETTMKYKIDGLSMSKSGGYTISYKINNTESIQKINVKEKTTTANFKYYITKTVDVKLDISLFDDSEMTLPDGCFIDYDLNVYDEDGSFVKRYSGRDLVRENVVIWRGCTIEIDGLFRDAPHSSGDTIVYPDTKKISETEKVSESDMRNDYFDGEYFEIRTSLRSYRPDDDD